MEVVDGTHNDTWYAAGYSYIRKLDEFMKEALKIPLDSCPPDMQKL